MSNFQKMEYKSSFQKSILNLVRFNAWQKNKTRNFFANLILNLCCKTPFGLLWAIKCVKTQFYIFTFKKKKFAVWPAKICLEQVWRTAPGLLLKDVSVRCRVRSVPAGRAGVEGHAGAAAWQQWERVREPEPPRLPHNLPCLLTRK